MLRPLLTSVLATGKVRASRLPRIKTSRVVDNPLLRKILTASPLAAHLLEDAYRVVLHRVARAEAHEDAADIGARLETLRARFPEALGESDEAPVFLLAAGWRSGSTLVQRVLMSGGDLMIWGEPFARAGLTTTLMSQLRCFTADWPPAAYFIDSFSGELSDQWIANSYPEVGRLLAAHRAFLSELLGVPARQLGRQRWGFKEVRLNGGHALYLSLLFPRARFIFLVRDPYACYASFRHYIKSDFIAWPERPVLSATDFGRMWREQVADFRRTCPQVGGFWLRYEDYLADPAVHEALCAYVGAELLPPRALKLIPSSGQKGASETTRPEHRLLWWERQRIRRQVGALGQSLGYPA
jgi:hypothetical protein